MDVWTAVAAVETCWAIVSNLMHVDVIGADMMAELCAVWCYCLSCSVVVLLDSWKLELEAWLDWELGIGKNDKSHLAGIRALKNSRKRSQFEGYLLTFLCMGG